MQTFSEFFKESKDNIVTFYPENEDEEDKENRPSPYFKEPEEEKMKGAVVF